MVKYPAMRENGSSTYYAEPEEGSEHAAMGYSLCMLRAGGRALNGNYRDPYLLAISRELEDARRRGQVVHGLRDGTAPASTHKSGASIRCVPTGFELSPPPADDYAEVVRSRLCGARRWHATTWSSCRRWRSTVDRSTRTIAFSSAPTSSEPSSLQVCEPP